MVKKKRKPKRQRRQQKTTLLNVETQGKLQKAAEAAGFLDVAEMVLALHEGGHLAELPDHKLLTVEERTLAEVGNSLAITLRATPKEQQDKLYSKLGPVQQGALVCHLWREGFSPANIALNLGVSENHVRQLWNEYADQIGSKVSGIRLNTLVGDMTSRMEENYQGLIRDGKRKQAMDIYNEWIEKMQNLGLVERAVYKQEVTHKLHLDQEGQMELENILAIRAKRAAAQEQMKRITVGVIEQENENETENSDGDVGDRDGLPVEGASTQKLVAGLDWPEDSSGLGERGSTAEEEPSYQEGKEEEGIPEVQ